MIFLESLKSMFGILSIIALGYFLRKRNWFHDSFSSNVSKLITNVSLPSAILYSVLKFLNKEILINLSNKIIYTLMAFILGYVIAYICMKLLKIKKGRRGVFINAVVNANTVFIGMPLNQTLFGEESTKFYLIYYIANTLSIWTIGSYFITNDSLIDVENTDNIRKSKIKWDKIFTPPLISFFFAMILLFSNITIPEFVLTPIIYVGNIATPLSLMYIGILLYDAGLKSISFDKNTIGVLILRLIASPIIMLAMISIGFELGNSFEKSEIQTYVIQNSLPVFAILPILVHESKGDLKFAMNVVTTSTILFAITVPIWMTLIS